MTVTLQHILDRLSVYAHAADLAPVRTAYEMALEAHKDQMRKSGEPYISHPLAVALILADLKMDVETIATAILHDTLEDAPITREEMAAEVGETITSLVDGVTKMGKLRFRSKEEQAAENFRKMMLAMSKDVRVILVKLADRLHNMRTIEFHREEKQRIIAQETLDIYVPIANRLGLTCIKDALHAACFGTLHADAHAHIQAYLEKTQPDRERYTAEVSRTLSECLEAEGVDCTVAGRAKEPHSIFAKMVSQDLEVHQVQDILAFRVLVGTVSDCYAALGLIHKAFVPVPSRIKDYVGRPKANGYQSLHTTVSGPGGRRVEVQIRTQAMDRVAESGVAAHWRYKEGRLTLRPDELLDIARVRDLFESTHDTDDAADFMEKVRVELYSDEVFVFTPAGDVKTFPKGATVLDFAYAVHSDVGHRCNGARVNGRMVPLKHRLRSGETIEILTNAKQEPKPDWLGMVNTGRAITRIQRHLKAARREQGEQLGRKMFEAELKRLGWTIKRAADEGNLDRALEHFNHKHLDTLLWAIAEHRAPLQEVVKLALPEGEYRARPSECVQSNNWFQRIRKPATTPVLISGEDGLMVSFAQCCSPLPGEAVAGFITVGKGIRVHRSNCAEFSKSDADRHVAVQWVADSETTHDGELRIYCSDRPGMLANISNVCEKNGVNINQVTTDRGSPGQADAPAVVTLRLGLRDIHELGRLCRAIEKLPDVVEVVRTLG